MLFCYSAFTRWLFSCSVGRIYSQRTGYYAGLMAIIRVKPAGVIPWITAEGLFGWMQFV